MDNAVVEAVSQVEIAITTARKYVENDLWSCSASQVWVLLRQVHRFRAQVESLELCLVREVVARGTPAEALGGQFTDTSAALAEGQICRERALAIVEVASGLPDSATVEQQIEVEEILLAHARVGAPHLGGQAKVLAHRIDTDGLEPEDEKAKKKRAAWLQRNGDGTQTLRWPDTDENVALLQAALEPLSGPVPGADGEGHPPPRDAWRGWSGRSGLDVAAPR